MLRSAVGEGRRSHRISLKKQAKCTNLLSLGLTRYSFLTRSLCLHAAVGLILTSNIKLKAVLTCRVNPKRIDRPRALGTQYTYELCVSRFIISLTFISFLPKTLFPQLHYETANEVHENLDAEVTHDMVAQILLDGIENGTLLLSDSDLYNLDEGDS